MQLSESIRSHRGGVASNPYQGKDKKVLFVCSMGILRSATAARMYAGKYNTRCAGTWGDALVPLSSILLAWADEIVFVNQENYQHAKDFYKEQLDDLNIRVLNIPDNHPHMDRELQKEFIKQYESL